MALGPGKHFVLERSLQGGNFLLYENSPDAGLLTGEDKGRQIGSKLSRNSADEEPKDVSSFLLMLTGLENRLLRSKSSGETKRLSFRNLTNLVCATETEIIEERSPIFSGIITNRTTEKSLFKLLLTGLDDSSIIAEPDDETAKSNLKGQKQIVTELLGRLEVAETEKDTATIEEMKQELSKLNDGVENCLQAVSSNLDSIDKLEAERKRLWTGRRELASKRTNQTELLARFQLLKSHYSTDLRRLEAIQEASSYLDQYGVQRCPLCGEPSCELHFAGQAGPEYAQNLEEIWESSRAEMRKISVLMEDLTATISETTALISNLDLELSKHDEALRAASDKLKKELEPAARSSSTQLRQLQARKEALSRSISDHEQRDYLQTKLLDIENQLEETAGSTQAKFTAVGSTKGTSDFSDEVYDLLQAIGFPGVQKIEFSEKETDIIVSGRPRSSHGKGVRAIFHASFLVALMDFCIRRDLPHPGFIVLDSPLVAYREPDLAVQEGLDSGIKDRFFTTMAEYRQGGQVIIFENEVPPREIEEFDGVSVIQFTKSENGRYGFFPF